MNIRCNVNKIRQVAGIFIVVLMALILAGCAAPTPTALPMLKPGDSIGGMTLQKGADKSEGPPIWALCPEEGGDKPGVVTVECKVPALPEMIIGPGFITKDDGTRDASWKVTKWELYLDGQAIDLNAFGTFDADMPMTGLPGHDPNEEVMTKLRSWDVLLANLKPGAHVLRSVYHVRETFNDGLVGDTAPGTYDLIINFTIEAG